MAAIYCFSSTGNSLYAAKMIAAAIGGTVLPMTGNPGICKDDVIGFVFPCYFWGLPRTVASFISDMQIENQAAYVFAVNTCGGPIFGVLGILKKLLKANGIRLRFGTRLITGSNYLPEFKVHDTEKRRQRIAKNLERIIAKLKNRDSNNVSSFTAINNAAYKLYPGKDSDQYFTVSSKCTGCGTCAKVCPLGNIEMDGGKPKFKHNCEHCIGCLHACPVAAIDWKKNTKGKERYRNHVITLDELIKFNSR